MRTLPGWKAALTFAKNWSDYFIVNRNRYQRTAAGLPQNTVFYRPGDWIYTPDDLIVWCLWDNHCTAGYIRHEVGEFLQASRGCSRLLDLGASAGFFSAIFHDAAGPDAVVHSIEPDLESFRLLEETRRLNGYKKSNEHWVLSRLALSDAPGKAEFTSTGLGGSLGGKVLSSRNVFSGNEPALAEPTRFAVEIETLEDYCARHRFTPDLIKLDIESYEYEVLMQARPFLEKHRPCLHLELHNALLRARQKDPCEVLQTLFAIGYAPPGGPDDRGKAMEEAKGCGSSHFRLS